MAEKYRSYFENLKGKSVAVIGIGVSNLPLIYMLLDCGACVTARDKKSPEELGGTYQELISRGARIIAGSEYLEGLTEEIIFKTPGMRFDVSELVRAREQGSTVTSEMEVFMELCPAKVFAVTGSDGKTTTTTLIYEMLSKAGYRCHVGGNIGAPLLPKIAQIGEKDMVVLELSSFQLHTMRKSPDVAVITNLSPNHLDVHKSMEEYVDAKRNIYRYQEPSSRLVLNRDCTLSDEIYEENAKREGLWCFSKAPHEQDGAYLIGDDIIVRENGCDTFVMKRSDIRIPGIHNVENYLAASAAVWGHVSKETILEVARSFGGVEHRIEFVRELDGVRYYNDSIASSPTRMMAALASFDEKLIVIAGGYDKKIPFEPMSDAVIDRVKMLVLIGQTSDKIEAAIRSNPRYDGKPEIVRADSFEDAINRARAAAGPGDVVILSPACASFDLFKNFALRGDTFKKIVNGLK